MNLYPRLNPSQADVDWSKLNKVTKMNKPSEAFFMAEACSNPYNSMNYANAWGLERKNLPGAVSHFDVYRHDGKFNVLFFDGHVNGMMLTEVPAGANSLEVNASAFWSGK